MGLHPGRFAIDLMGMGMKKTEPMDVVCSQHIPAGEIYFHPNEGFDLGLLTKGHDVEWCVDLEPDAFLRGQKGTVLPCRIELKNECKLNTIELNIHEWKRVGMPDRAVVFFDGRRIFLYGLKKEAEG